MIQKIKISEIQERTEFMARERIDHELVAQYQYNLKKIIDLSPIEIFDTPEGLIVSDGYHRLAAARNLGWLKISCNVKIGSVNDAFAAACLANLQHGKPLTRSERENAVKQYIKLKPEQSNGVIAAKTGLSTETIRLYRIQLENEDKLISPPKRIGLDGKIQSGSKKLEPKQRDMLGDARELVQRERVYTQATQTMESRIRAERRAGIIVFRLHTILSKKELLESLNITVNQALGWTFLADIPEEEFEEYLSTEQGQEYLQKISEEFV